MANLVFVLLSLERSAAAKSISKIKHALCGNEMAGPDAIIFALYFFFVFIIVFIVLLYERS